MRLVVCEKPSAAMSIARALDVKIKRDGYMEGNGWLISWCVGHLAGLAEAGGPLSGQRHGAQCGHAAPPGPGRPGGGV